MTICNNLVWSVEVWAKHFLTHTCLDRHIERAGYAHSSRISNLKRLRLNGIKLPCYKEKLHFYFGNSNMPALEVLELDVQCNLSLHIEIALQSLVVVVARKLSLFMSGLCKGPSPNLMYVQSGNDFWPTYKEDQQASLAGEQNAMPINKLPEYVKDEEDHWIARRPASFHPSSLRDCCCNACLECLARAGVPILCEPAWTSNGFDKHLRPHCREES